MQTRVDVFEEIFMIFLGLGALVGVIVIAYVMYNAYKYRDDGTAADGGDVPTLGELPTGGKGGKKLFLSFGLSAIIVLSLVVWTYGMLLYVEDGPEDSIEDIEYEIEVTGDGFAWFFDYSKIDGEEYGEDEQISTASTMTIPAGEPIAITVTGGDVWHNFGIPEQRVKADAIPGEHDTTWFEVDEPGEYEIECFELCGPSHGQMVGTLEVLEPDEFDEWVEDELPEEEDEEDTDEEQTEEDENSDGEETDDGSDEEVNN